MPANLLKTEIRHQAGLAIVELCGDVDGSGEEALEAAYAEAESRDSAAILLNFEQVPYINSKGIALIVTLLRRARQAGRELLACGLTEHYREIFQITRLSEYINVCDNEDLAIASAPRRGTGAQSYLERVPVPAESEREA
jgi:anti-anti-sigma factor